MPTATKDGIRIHYQIEGSGPPIVLHTGFMGRLEDWYRTGFVDALKDDYQLILLDPRGQGRSDKPHDPADYTLTKRVSDVVNVLDAAGVPTAHYLGYSMAARIGFGIGVYAPERFASLIVGGHHPYGGDSMSDDSIGLLQRSVRDWVDEWERNHGTFPPGLYDQWIDNDGQALAAHQLALRQYPNLAEHLPNIELPALIYCGSDDYPYERAKQAAEAMPNATFIGFDGHNHAQVFRNSEMIVPHIKAFLQRVPVPA